MMEKKSERAFATNVEMGSNTTRMDLFRVIMNRWPLLSAQVRKFAESDMIQL